MYELKKIGKVFSSKFVGTGPSSYKKRIYRAAFSQTLRKTDLGYSQLVTSLLSSENILRHPSSPASLTYILPAPNLLHASGMNSISDLCALHAASPTRGAHRGHLVSTAYDGIICLRHSGT